MRKILDIPEKCTGCSACVAVCPVHCIQLIENEEGFLYPQVDEAKCINCGKCVEHCFTQHGHLWNGDTVQYHPENCVGCGVCVRECPEKALILRLKDEKDRYDWPDSCLDLYDRQGADTYGLKTDYIERGRKK